MPRSVSANEKIGALILKLFFPIPATIQNPLYISKIPIEIQTKTAVTIPEGCSDNPDAALQSHR